MRVYYVSIAGLRRWSGVFLRILLLLAVLGVLVPRLAGLVGDHLSPKGRSPRTGDGLPQALRRSEDGVPGRGEDGWAPPAGRRGGTPAWDRFVRWLNDYYRSGWGASW